MEAVIFVGVVCVVGMVCAIIALFAKQECILSSISYIFDEAGDMRDQLEQAILNELQVKQYPLQARVVSMKAAHTTETCVAVDLGHHYRVLISNTKVGTYLYVEVYMTRSFSGANLNKRNQELANLDIFEQQRRAAVYAAAVEASESAFAKLSLKQNNYGYKSTTKENSRVIK